MIKDLTKILIWIFIFALALLLQANRFFELYWINPDLFLLAVFLAAILEKNFWTFLVSAFLLFLSSFLFWPFFIKEIIILAVLGLAAFVLKNFLTGNPFFDYLILVFSGTLAFYLIADYRYFGTDLIAITAEVIYNLVLAAAIFFIIGKFSSDEKKTRIKS